MISVKVDHVLKGLAVDAVTKAIDYADDNGSSLMDNEIKLTFRLDGTTLSCDAYLVKKKEEKK